MTEPIKPPADAITLAKVSIAVREGKLYIWPNRANPGAPVVVPAEKLGRWASQIYRAGVLQ